MELTLLCFKIFFARILDVSIGTVRTTFIVRNKNKIAAVLACFEVMIWFIIAREALNTELKSIWIVIAYSAGYATGTFIGTTFTKYFVNGIVGVQVVSKDINKKDIAKIREQGFGVSVMELTDDYEGIKKQMLYFQINNKTLKKLITLIKGIDPEAFIIVNDTKYIQNGYLK